VRSCVRSSGSNRQSLMKIVHPLQNRACGYWSAGCDISACGIVAMLVLKYAAHAGRCPAAPRLAPGCRHAFAGIVAADVLPWIHRVFTLMKRWGLGTYHGLRRKHVDTYLNEFVFRYNRRFYRHVSFETMLGLAAHHHPTSCWDIASSPEKLEPSPVSDSIRQPRY
jgi:hypothetical protein